MAAGPEAAKGAGPPPHDPFRAARGRDSDAMLVQIKGVLPPRIADGAAAIVARVADSKWNTLEGDGDPAKPAFNVIPAAHRFGAVVDPSGVRGGPELLKALSRLMPPADNRHASFHLGRYEEGDFLAPQNDAAYCAVDAGSKDSAKAGQIIKCSRDIGIMLFLSKNRTEAGGGMLRDLHYQHRADHKGATYVPEFNSLIAFHVPREYEITPVRSEDPLLSVFGWFLQEGELYDLRAPDAAAGEDSSKKKSIKERAKATKRKLRLKARREEKLSDVPEFLQALAAEREQARQNKEFSRADAIRTQCLRAGYRFNAGGKLVKIADTATGDTSKDAKKPTDVKAPRHENPAPGTRGGTEKEGRVVKGATTSGKSQEAGKASAAPAGDAPAKKKKESKAQRLQRQAKEAAAAAGEGARPSGGVAGDGDSAPQQEKGEAGGEVEGDADRHSDLGKRAGEGEGGLGGRKQKRSRGADSQQQTEADGSSPTVQGGEKRKRKGEEAQATWQGEAAGGDRGDPAAKSGKSKSGGKSNAARLLALSAGSAGGGDSQGGPGSGSETVRGMGKGSAEGGGSREESGEKILKVPKKPKKSKVAKKAAADGSGEGDEPREGRRGRGAEMLLARIKNKGWMAAAPQTQTA